MFILLAIPKELLDTELKANYYDINTIVVVSIRFYYPLTAFNFTEYEIFEFEFCYLLLFYFVSFYKFESFFKFLF
jgi:hypothetical protein